MTMIRITVSITLCLLFLCSLSVQSQTWQNITPKEYIGESFNKIAYLNDQKGFILSKKGHLIVTENGGETWDIGAKLDTVALQEILIENNVIYILSGFRLFKSVDEGETWSTLLDILSTDYFLESIGVKANANFQKVGNNMFVMGNGCIYKSSNGGENWNAVFVNSNWMGFSINLLYFQDSQNGIAYGYDGLYLKTANGGDTWTINDFGDNHPYFRVKSIIEIASDSILVLSSDTLFYSKDGGETLHRMYSLEKEAVSFVKLLVQDESMILLEGWEIYSSHNGIDWTKHEVDPVSNGGYLLDIIWHNGILWSVGQSTRILSSNNGGESWDYWRWGSNRIKSAEFFNANIGCMFLGDGIFLGTVNGGASWYRIELGNGSERDLFEYIDETTIVASSKNYIHKSTDGGRNWTEIYTGLQNGEIFLNFVNQDTGFVGADVPGGSFVITYDGGSTWNRTIPFVINDGAQGITNLVAHSSSHWTLCAYEELIVTKDAGRTWTDIALPNSLRNCHVFSDEHQIAFDQRGNLYETTSNWSSYDTYNVDGASLVDFYSVNSNMVYIHYHTANDSDSIVRTVNGGSTWELMNWPYEVDDLMQTDTSSAIVLSGNRTELFKLRFNAINPEPCILNVETIEIDNTSIDMSISQFTITVPQLLSGECNEYGYEVYFKDDAENIVDSVHIESLKTPNTLTINTPHTSGNYVIEVYETGEDLPVISSNTFYIDVTTNVASIDSMGIKIFSENYILLVYTETYVDIEIYSMEGKLLHFKKNTNFFQTNLETGLYLLSINGYNSIIAVQ